MCFDPGRLEGISELAASMTIVSPLCISISVCPLVASTWLIDVLGSHGSVLGI
jgi:hypothetical protein